ncbi:Polyketide cyclase / dehydrase and lipid transport [Saccharopolyspora antimicrobica]|uniref:Polyketide cyclase / dehydrase and lipid transport n=1 Tax=Saccharopolyspora antimicrobica TaxID=455193 RepID=A0A1I5CL99_9PSEU|nr:SRPBCC domain-containing protein [Saccharopolyspora antimicrobica]RKT88818.1 polyketide cyclase/dehydrase/lipid transport protein [Saccharopolyspora antimicrobica]SFN87779.1 Polyketide cyclase / dehydrase and lipid transport [Saccharopolyspora antimicrobica]
MSSTAPTPPGHTTIESVTVEIGAPARFVWDVLVDYPGYDRWNPFTVHVETSLEIGSPIALTLPNADGSAGTFVSREHIRAVEPPHHLRYDTGEEIPGIFSVRDQWIEPLGENRCSYRTVNTFSGEHAEAMLETMGPWLKAGFDSVARALRKRAEELWSA